MKVECYNLHSGGKGFEGRSDGIYKQICEMDSDFVYLMEYVGRCSPKLDKFLCADMEVCDIRHFVDLMELSV